jgi:hypothetical protein
MDPEDPLAELVERVQVQVCENLRHEVADGHPHIEQHLLRPDLSGTLPSGQSEGHVLAVNDSVQQIEQTVIIDLLAQDLLEDPV